MKNTHAHTHHTCAQIETGQGKHLILLPALLFTLSKKRVRQSNK